MPEIFLASGSSWTIPLDCIKIDSIDCFAAGGSGAVSAWATPSITGGGGGAFSRKNNIPVTPGGVISYGIGIGGAGVAIGTPGQWIGGNPGGDTWAAYNSAYVCYAQGGRGGNVSTAGGAGGDASAGIGDVRYSGGRGGNAPPNSAATGGGGCAGPNGNGINGGDLSSTADSSGGYGDNYAGGAGSVGVGTGVFNANQTSAQGGTGTEMGSGYGAGGGSGSARVAGNSVTATSGVGGQFGGGSGAAMGVSSGNVGISSQGNNGFIIIRYTPVKRLPPQNLPMMGL